jgi:HK97 family phage major capsid protein
VRAGSARAAASGRATVSTGGDDQYTGSVRVYKVDESPTSTQAATDARYGAVTIPVYTMMGHVAVSKNLIDDSSGAAAITPYLQSQFASAYAVFEDEQFLIGNGVGGPQGILQNATTGGPYTYAYGAVATVNSGAEPARSSGGAAERRLRSLCCSAAQGSR